MKVPLLKNALKSYNDIVLYELDWYKKNIPLISHSLEKLYQIQDDRLPTTLYPLNYNLSIVIKDKEENFTGSVKINLRVDKPTFRIILNSHKLKISNITVYETLHRTSDKEVKHFDVLGIVQNQETEKLIIYLKTHIEVPRVTVEMDFIGEMNTKMKGLHHAQYKDSYETRYV